VSATLRAIPAYRAPGTRRSAADASRITLRRLGPAACRDDELLAMVIGGADSLSAARQVLAELGGLAGLATAGIAELGPLGARRTVPLLASIELGRRIACAIPTQRWQVRAPTDLAERLLPAMAHLEREELRVVLLTTKNSVIAMATVYVGNLAGSSVRVGEVFREAVRRQAASVVVAHNHPSGDPAPSSEDLRITADLAQAGRLLDIELLDHLVIGHGRWVSLRALGAL
jgi:DNA repair protein RadC